MANKKSFSTAERSGIVYDNGQITLGGLANATAVLVGSKIDSARLNGFRILKSEIWLHWRDFTAGEGPIMAGLSVGNSQAEVEGTFTADPQSSQDELANTQAKLPVFPIAMFSAQNAAQLLVDHHGFMTLLWSVIEGVNLDWYVHNISGAALTTGSNLKFFAKHYGVWLRD